MKARKALNEVVSSAAPSDNMVYVQVRQDDDCQDDTVYGPISKQEVARLNQRLKVETNGFLGLQEVALYPKEVLVAELEKDILADQEADAGE